MPGHRDSEAMSMNQRLNPFSAARRRAQGDDGIALLLVVMAMLILSSLSLLALSAVVVQAKPTQFARKDVQTVNAVEAGRDAALAAIRHAIYNEGSDVYG